MLHVGTNMPEVREVRGSGEGVHTPSMQPPAAMWPPPVLTLRQMMKIMKNTDGGF